MNLFLIVYISWGLSEVFLNRFVRSGKTDKQAADNHTELYLWVTIVLSIIAGSYAAMKINLPIFFNIQYSYIGIGLMIGGIIFRFVAIRQLGRFFTVDVTIRQDHELTQSGLYKYLRHPSYSGALLTFFGFGLSLNNWVSLFVVMLPVIFTFILRINHEEKVLTQQFGKAYTDYISRTKRMIPFIY